MIVPVIFLINIAEKCKSALKYQQHMLQGIEQAYKRQCKHADITRSTEVHHKHGRPCFRANGPTCPTHPLQVLSEVCEEFEASVQDVLLLLGQVVHLVPL